MDTTTSNTVTEIIPWDDASNYDCMDRFFDLLNSTVKNREVRHDLCNAARDAILEAFNRGRKSEQSLYGRYS
jgi:hypothetical protein